MILTDQAHVAIEEAVRVRRVVQPPLHAYVPWLLGEVCGSEARSCGSMGRARRAPSALPRGAPGKCRAIEAVAHGVETFYPDVPPGSPLGVDALAQNS